MARQPHPNFRWNAFFIQIFICNLEISSIKGYLRYYPDMCLVAMNFATHFQNFIEDTMIWLLNSKLDLNIFCAKDFWNLISMVTWCLNWRRLLALIIFQRSSFPGGTSFVDLLCFCFVLCLLCLCARLFICALWSPAEKGLTSWLSFVVSNCEFVTFPLVSWVGCGTWLYQLLIFAPLVTLLTFRVTVKTSSSQNVASMIPTHFPV